MKHILNIEILKNKYYGFLSLVVILSGIACEDTFEYELPEANSKADLTPPSASFSISPTDDFLTFTFGNNSSSATDYVWDFGDGNTSTDVDGTNTYPDEGTYTVTLTATDKLGVSSTVSQTIEVIEPEVPLAITPKIGGAAFDDGVDDSCPDSRDCWRIEGATIHQTTSDGEADTRGAKYPSGSDNNRVTYQAVKVSPNTKYVLTARYALQADGDSVRASVIDGQLGNFSEFADATLLAQESGTVNEGKGNFNTLTVAFETGANGEISILFDHDGNAKDSYLDNVAIAPVEEQP
ncbi:PKD domain-containing protein [Zobellia uliginosa]|uniref:PKD domain-containing protein n=1 Tax=Zobellia uliginosa TaxID=143224 RepID=UPI0026E14470|nr:PKD domain-containing protein [Zobellia uliginosa]MDO6517700.1 PKD domain-containing protein [Zobellia uliginosa]